MASIRFGIMPKADSGYCTAGFENQIRASEELTGADRSKFKEPTSLTEMVWRDEFVT
jgi:hypothetical protein